MIAEIQGLVKSGRLAEARAVCARQAGVGKKSATFQRLWGELERAAGNLQAAERLCRKAVKLKGDDPENHSALAMVLHAVGKYAAAETSYRRVLKLWADQPVVRFNLGAVLQAQGRDDGALEEYLAATRLRPGYAKAHANAGYLLRRAGRFEEALEHYEAAVQAASDIPEIHFNLGLTLFDLGRDSEAEAAHRRAIELRPEYADPFSALGNIFLARGEYDLAIGKFRRALEIDEKHADACRGMAAALRAQRNDEAAVQYLHRALEAEPGHVGTRLALGSVYLALGQPGKTSEICEGVLSEEPDNEDASIMAANAAEKMGQPQKACELLEPYLIGEEVRTDAAIVFASVSKAVDRQEEAVAVLEKVLAREEEMDESDRALVYFALGSQLDALREYDRAFSYFKKGNELSREKYDHHHMVEQVDSSVRFFTPEAMAGLPRSSVRSDRPVFVVGMPRSGTTLVEQILGSHPRVYPAGELDNIPDLVRAMRAIVSKEQAYPACIGQLAPVDMDRLAKTYLDFLDGMAPDADRVVDKMPGNFMHLGLIELLFPDARIIHCVRNPLDTCLSCFFQNFREFHVYTNDLEDLGRYYREYRRLMEHWKNVLNVPILDLCYEDLVEDPEHHSRRLIEFCGLEWDDRCLEFHKSKRLAWTASYQQVRQPIYRKSRQRWKNYERHMGSLIEALGGCVRL
ncbi:sulfotransferase [Thiohalobacter sp. IOR34]|uniref:tetratricopeptide repeat-containing sulfotransferase family protein n=1 Tax=Thiohalobacter sp. IOR34 TaxID=3057176 RepID=UPI0025B11852|nr:tetratricopeptide repeat-containing sulfotransferase family protein [Thiohalobacter sp. IOR34]WJW75196.1 sulfotransferase [Thiohalobacter sp. IOR34]